MLLFSTILNIDPSMTKEAFISLIEEWNETQSHPENIIEGLKWNGQPESQYGDERLFIQIIDHKELGIIAARYEKHSGNGAIWDTDYIFNYREMRLAIHLNRSYHKIQLGVDSSFSTPHFITLLIEKGYLSDDGNLPMNNKPIELNEERFAILSDLVENGRPYSFPVVFVSKTHENTNPVDVDMLASKLKGVAHVLVQTSIIQALALRDVCNGKEEYFGGVGIYLPNGGHQQLRYTANSGYDAKLYDDIHRIIMRHANEHAAPVMYTWQGIRNDMTLKTMSRVISDAQLAQAKAEQDKEEFIDAFDSDTERLRKRIDELRSENEEKEREITLLRMRAAAYNATPILYMGSEQEFYTDEIKDILLSILDAAIRNMDEESRRYHIVSDILASNDYQHLAEARRDRLKSLFNGGDRHLTAKIRAGLEELGFEITSDGEHHKIKYYQDNRYWAALPKSGSDWRGNMNSVSEIAKHMF